MSSFRLHLIIATVVALCCISTTSLFGQTGGSDKSSAKTKLAEIMRSKGSKAPFVLLTPADLSSISRSELDAVLAGPCDTFAPIVYGQTVNGALSSQDCRLDDGSYADLYSFNAATNDRITIDLTSAAFDAYLGLFLPQSTIAYEDDDSGGGTNARLSVLIGYPGTYVIIANSAFANEFGNYSLSLALAPPCTYTLQPSAATVPGAGGTFTFDVVTPPYCTWYAQSNNYPALIVDPNNGNGSGTGNETVVYSVGVNGTGSTRTLTVTVANQTFTVTQPSIDCNYSINPTSLDLPGAAMTAEFTVNVQAGCVWTAVQNSSFISVNSQERTGSGTVSFFTIANNGPNERNGTITAGGRTLTVRQAGLNCSYSVSPMDVWRNSSPGTGQITVNTQPGCTWYIWSSSHISFPGGLRTGPGTIQYSIAANPILSSLNYSNEFTGHDVVSIPISFHQAPWAQRFRFDTDGDRKADIALIRPGENRWYFAQSTAGYGIVNWGEAGDLAAPADYDGDGKTDVAVFRPSSGTWYIIMSTNGAFRNFSWGQNGDIPLPADHNGDGKADLVLFRPSNNTWYMNSTMTGPFAETQFGEAGDKPQIGDFDRDGRADLAVYRPANNNWYIIKSTEGYFVQTWGEAGDIPTTGDFDGDGATDQAVFRPSTGQWYLSRTTAGFSSQFWGQNGDIPVAADYDGDGKTDVAVFRPSNATWYIVQSTAGILIQQFGQTGDAPTQSSYLY